MRQRSVIAKECDPVDAGEGKTSGPPRLYSLCAELHEEHRLRPAAMPTGMARQMSSQIGF
jgi:hypothetical protein